MSDLVLAVGTDGRSGLIYVLVVEVVKVEVEGGSVSVPVDSAAPWVLDLDGLAG